MLDSLNRSVVFAGAMMTLVIAVPAALVSGLLSDGGGTDQSNWVYLALFAIIVAYLLGGALAGRALPSAPFLNGAAATVLAFAIVQGIGIIVRIARGDDVSIIALIFNGLLAASFGTVGAFLGMRWAARQQAARER